MPKSKSSPLARLLRGATEGPTVRPDLGPCLDYRKPVSPACRYPSVKINGRETKGNRVILEDKLRRPIKPGYCALHHCDRTGCLRAAHIYEGTLKDNARDRDERTGNIFSRLSFPGESAPNARLTNALVLEIRSRVTAGERQTAVGRCLGISPGHIHLIVKRKIWNHV